VVSETPQEHAGTFPPPTGLPGTTGASQGRDTGAHMSMPGPLRIAGDERQSGGASDPEEPVGRAQGPVGIGGLEVGVGRELQQVIEGMEAEQGLEPVRKSVVRVDTEAEACRGPLEEARGSCGGAREGEGGIGALSAPDSEKRGYAGTGRERRGGSEQDTRGATQAKPAGGVMRMGDCGERWTCSAGAIGELASGAKPSTGAGRSTEVIDLVSSDDDV
jgi:hypothetical protein